MGTMSMVKLPNHVLIYMACAVSDTRGMQLEHGYILHFSITTSLVLLKILNERATSETRARDP